jgi:hypothetical protein
MRAPIRSNHAGAATPHRTLVLFRATETSYLNKGVGARADDVVGVDVLVALVGADAGVEGLRTT